MSRTDEIIARERARRQAEAEAAARPKGRRTTGEKKARAGRAGKAGPARRGGWWALLSAWEATAAWATVRPTSVKVLVAVLRRCRRIEGQYRYTGGLAPLAKSCGCSHRTVSECLVDLETHGMLKRRHLRHTYEGGVRSCIHLWPQWPGEGKRLAADSRLPGLEESRRQGWEGKP